MEFHAKVMEYLAKIVESWLLTTTELLAHSALLAQIVEALVGVAVRLTELMTVDKAGSTKVGSSLNPEIAEFGQHVANRGAHRVQADVGACTEGAGEEPGYALPGGRNG